MALRKTVFPKPLIEFGDHRAAGSLALSKALCSVSRHAVILVLHALVDRAAGTHWINAPQQLTQVGLIYLCIPFHPSGQC